MTGGAFVAIAAAAHAKRVQDVVDAFRLADATAPARARSLADLAVVRDGVVDELSRANVLVPGAQAGTWYLSETAVVARRDAQSHTGRNVVLGVLVGIAVVLGGLLVVKVWSS